MNEQLPKKITLGKEKIPFSEISKKFSSTDWGKKLKDNARYSRFKPAKITTEEWKKILGGDVNNLDHLIVTKGIASSFIKGCDNPGDEWQGLLSEEAQFSPEEKQLLLLTATVHDWGEAMKGDIPYYEKKDKDHHEEMLELRIMINKILGEMLEGKEKEKIEKITEDVIDVLTRTDSKLGKAFNAIEKVGYVRTGIRAFDESKKTTDEKMKILLQKMSIEVVLNHTRALLDYAKIYPPVAAYIKYHRETLNKIFEEGENSNIKASILNFKASRKSWLSQNLF